MVNIPEDYKYTEEHEWAVLGEDGIIEIGITDYAQEALGEIVFVELPNEGDEVSVGDPFGGVESTKSVSDLYAPISGEVVEVNEELLESPEIINEDPYGNGWIIRVKPQDDDDYENLMDADAYKEFLEEEIEEDIDE